jgi:hypothetical protein
VTDDHVDIVDADTYRVVGHCKGPVAGACSIATRIVRCASRRIAPAEAAPEYSMLWVPPGTRHCPLMWNLEGRRLLRPRREFQYGWPMRRNAATVGTPHG